MDGLHRLQEIVRKLRGPGGCPWDQAQTSASLVPSLIEELYEVVDTIERKDAPHLREELGDLLLHVIFQTEIAAEAGDFTLNDVFEEICEKLIRRHPHVFGEVSLPDTAAVLKQWDEIKRAEKGGKQKSASLLDGVPTSFPALLRAAKLQSKAAKVGFDWPSADPVFEKIAEETREIHDAIAAGNKASIEDEVGDLLFSVVNLARKLNLEPELALQRASDKFARRFSTIEKLASEQNVDLKSLSLDEMDALWGKAKASLSKV